MKKKSNLNLLNVIFLLAVILANISFAEEGMYPLSEIHKLKLKEAGLKIDAIDVYNPNGISLIDALVKVGGCTGSFVSDQGLILTNHHCAFGSISRASTPENNYLENGFLAETKLDEIPAKGLTVRITESYEDVSNQILEAVKNIDDLAERTKIIDKKMDEISKVADDSVNSIEGSVSEMFIGKTYILFKYRIIKDVRIVYAPPRSIGEFGGETDNWVWPRHTGDFTFMRAYVAPDGSAAEYAENNIPFKPKKFLKVNPNGVEEGDFTFILGYPGRTYRYLPSYFLQYQQNYQLPYISQTYNWMIDQLEKIGADNTELQLKFAPTIKGLANAAKNYKGKLKGLKRINLVEQKQNEEKDLQNFIENNPVLKEKYINLLPQFAETYNNLFEIADANLWFRTLSRYSIIYKICKLHLEMQKPKDNRDKEFAEFDLDKYDKKLSDYYKDYNEAFEFVFLKKMFSDAYKFNGKSIITTINDFFKNKPINETFNYLIINNRILTIPSSIAILPKNDFFEDSLFILMKKLDSEYKTNDEEYDRITGSISKLSAELYEVKKEWKQTSFIPDANGTLRLTYGYIKGYSPADAVNMKPITTLDGVIDKSLLGGEYVIPDKLKVLYDNKDFGQFYEENLGSVPVGILYNMDTTGGNSGSPIMNANGEMIGINFDRAYEATINDFAWNESYSRSIGVDIRYVLWLTQKLGGADYLLTEMDIN